MRCLGVDWEGPLAAMADGHEHEKQTLKSYYELLRDNRCFRIIWIGEVRIQQKNSVGNTMCFMC